jgi:thiol-disulfide isomerase/thioredoxin
MENSLKSNLSVIIVVIAAIAIMLIVGKNLAKRPRIADNTPSGGRLVGKTAPDFALESLDGKTVHLSDFRGKAVLLNFWATWCEPCKVEMPWFVDLQKRYGPEGLAIVGVAMDDSGKETIANFAKDMGVNYPVLLGKEAVGDQFGGIPYLPVSFYIDRNGQVVGQVAGLKGRGEIEDYIKDALNHAKPTQQNAQARSVATPPAVRTTAQ